MATMDELAPPHDPPAGSSLPQIRSRITVVCAECKRLKLKCDRRTPCGSCTKRGTVPRCVYSAAAAEKVDLHSLNNRLMQVEAILAMVTAGQSPPPFQSSYPLAQVALPVTSSATKVRASPIAAPPTPSVSIHFNDLASIWLAHCHLDSYGPGFPDTARSTQVKVEPSLVDNLLSPPASLGRSATQHVKPPVIVPSAHFCLPPLYTYYLPGVLARPSSVMGQPDQANLNTRCPSSQNHSSNLTKTSYDYNPSPHTPVPSSNLGIKPVATNALFEFLPPPATRIKLLNRARNAYPHIPLIVSWSRLVDLADPNGKEEKARKITLANAVFFNGSRGAEGPTSIQRQVSSTFTFSTDFGLPLFISLCYILALGALETGSEGPPSADPAFLHALGGQALSIWEEFRISLNNQDPRESQSGSDEAGRGKQETEELDYLVACLFQVKYLLRVRSLASASPDRLEAVSLNAVFPLVGKLVNLALGLGLARVPEDSVESAESRGVKNKERRRLIWWDIMFYDTFVSDSLGHPASVSLLAYSTCLPAIARLSGSPPAHLSMSASDNHSQLGNGRTSDQPGLSIVQDPDNEISFDSESNCRAERLLSPESTDCTTRKGKQRTPAAPKLDDENLGFFGVRCRLTRLVQLIKYRLSSPGCECCTCGYGSGYTLDHAAALENEIRNWVAELPPSLKCDHSTPTSDDSKSTKHKALSAELSIFANRLIIFIYLPLMRPFDTNTSKSSWARTYAAHPWSAPSRAAVDAAQNVIRNGKLLHGLGHTDVTSGRTMMIGDYFSLGKAVLDATIICAHAAFGNGAVKTQDSGRVILEDITAGLELACMFGVAEGEAQSIVGTLQKKLEAVGLSSQPWESECGEVNVLKRKHSHLDEPRTEGEDVAHPNLEVRLGLEVLSENDHLEEESSSIHPPPPPPLIPRNHKQSTSPRSRPAPYLKPSHEKEKERKKRSTPSIGVRDRGKDGPPWMKRSSPSVSISPLDGTSDSRNIETIHNQSPSSFLSSLPHTPSELRSEHPSQPVDHAVDQGLVEQSHPAAYMSSVVIDESHVQPRLAEFRQSDVRSTRRRRLSHDTTQPESYRMPALLGTSPAIIYNSASKVPPSSLEDYEGQASFNHHGYGVDATFSSAPSPYPNSMSSTSSPFGSGSGSLLAPNFEFGRVLLSHDPSPPTFEPSPPSHHQIHFENHPEQMAVIGSLSFGPSNSDAPVRATITQTSNALPGQVYERPQQMLYQPKTTMDFDERVQMRYDVAGDHPSLENSEIPPPHHSQLSIEVTDRRVWASDAQYLQQRRIIDATQSQYWPTDVYF